MLIRRFPIPKGITKFYNNGEELHSMDYQEIIFTVIGIVLTAFVTWGAERLIALINSKIKDSKIAKYLTDAVDAVTRAVKSTYQTYVQALKGKDAFTAEAQAEAFAKAKDMALKQLSAETKQFISDNFGDMEVWMQGAIESAIYDLKNKYKEKGENGNESA